MSATTSQKHPVLLPPIALDEARWMELLNRFSDGTVLRIYRNVIDIQFDSLRHEVSVLAPTIRRNMSIDITYTGLSRLFGHADGWAQGMIARHMQKLQSDNLLTLGRPRLPKSDGKKKPV